MPTGHKHTQVKRKKHGKKCDMATRMMLEVLSFLVLQSECFLLQNQFRLVWHEDKTLILVSTFNFLGQGTDGPPVFPANV